MRVTSGTKRGAVLYTQEGFFIRPTADKIKQSVFNSIQFEIEGRKALDLFSGSGALGIEALSRNAAFCTFVDIDITMTKKNIDKLSLNDRAFCVKNSYNSFLHRQGEKYSLVFLDPPYNKGYIDNSLNLLEKNNLLEDGAIITAECDFLENIKIPSVFKVRREALFGRIKIFILKYGGNNK